MSPGRRLGIARLLLRRKRAAEPAAGGATNATPQETASGELPPVAELHQAEPPAPPEGV